MKTTVLLIISISATMFVGCAASPKTEHKARIQEMEFRSKERLKAAELSTEEAIHREQLRKMAQTNGVIFTPPVVTNQPSRKKQPVSQVDTQKSWGTEPIDHNFWAKSSPASPKLAEAPAKGSLPESKQLVETKPSITGYVRYSPTSPMMYPGYASYGRGYYPSPSSYGYGRGYYPTYQQSYRSYTYVGVGAGIRIGGYSHCRVSHRHSHGCR
jgi:hypothetical protein